MNSNVKLATNKMFFYGKKIVMENYVLLQGNMYLNIYRPTAEKC